jgi:hypothetical protein
MRLLSRCFILIFAMMFVLAGCKSETPAAPTGETEAVVTQAVQDAAPVATNTPRPTRTPRPTPALVFTPTGSPTPTATPEPPTATPEPTLEPTSTPTPTKAPVSAAPIMRSAAPKVLATSAVTVLDDPNYAPPFSVHVSANYALEDYRYLVSGVIRNDSTENYVSLGIVATFFTDTERRYGPIKVNAPCLLLAPGAECPFVVEALSKSLVSVILHPEGRPTDRTSASVTVNGGGSYTDNVGFVHITGRVTNSNPYAVKNATVTGALVDGNGAIVKAGSTTVMDILEPNASVAFDIAVRYAPYTTYRLFTQAEPK